MATGLVALLDDVAAIARVAAASLDDVAAAAGKAGTKAAGVVIDDAAVAPQYVTGFTPDRELPMIAKIAKGSIKNKLIFLLPGALLLASFAPWLITPILMMGGLYLCFEGAEKVLEVFHVDETNVQEAPVLLDATAREDEMVSGAIRTDLILSAEIMAISLNEVADQPLWMQALALILISFVITGGVYGAVALIVKMDDAGLALAKRPGAAMQAFGSWLVRAMPGLLKGISIIGTAAMLWVGGQLILHGLAEFGFDAPEHILHVGAAAIGGVLSGTAAAIAEWIAFAVGSGIFGLVLGAVIALVVHKVKGPAH
ncbi:DUF808 domain-containing protein [Pacificimonas sp. WHA3]|uniref:DUF808 domain-containing protein n=1 Tax=Pacificimonas pallii TaxID=2827236 RepID=A0ABS6SAJ8_9SPHN|nr:DUF808 domain-containing protein [Pacificimonas pallii]MBV7255412.1 DUF808 domain-containing protein [Pacificimonas pallii]